MIVVALGVFFNELWLAILVCFEQCWVWLQMLQLFNLRKSHVYKRLAELALVNGMNTSYPSVVTQFLQSIFMPMRRKQGSSHAFLHAECCMSQRTLTEDPFVLSTHASLGKGLEICHEHTVENKLSGKKRNSICIYGHETACLGEISMFRSRWGQPNQDVKPSLTFLDKVFSNAWVVTTQEICGGEIVR